MTVPIVHARTRAKSLKSTDRELVNRLMKRSEVRKAVTSRISLIRYLVDQEGWKPARAESAVDAAIADPDIRLKIGRGGSLKYSGVDASIYVAVTNCLKQWTPRKGWRIQEPIDCHSYKGARGNGEWVYPDIVVLADPLRRSSKEDRLEVHAFEVEQIDGFSIKSVYQAFEQGRGANYAWVMFAAKPDDLTEWKALARQDAKSTPTEGTGSHAVKTRILRAARELGVGLVVMGEPHARTTWHEVIAPRRRLTSQVAQPDLHLLIAAARLTQERLHSRTAGKGQDPTAHLELSDTRTTPPDS